MPGYSYFLILLLISFQPLLADAQLNKTIKIKNPDGFERQDELVILKRKDLEHHLGQIPGYVNIHHGGKQLEVQFDDLDNDHNWDEAVFLYSFKPHETADFKLGLTQKPLVSTAQRAHVRLRKKNNTGGWGNNLVYEEMPVHNPATDFSKQPLPIYLTEGPAWENDKVGFRLYFDVRNGKDIWGKRTGRMVLDSVGTKAEPSYHNLGDWGMDILHSGTSLGAGALAFLVPVNGHDTLMRLGGKNITGTSFKQIADGPDRAVFQMQYDWMVQNSPVKVTEQISIWGGQYFYESRIWTKGFPAGTRIVAGISNFYDNVFRTFKTGKTNVLFSFGQQSENKDNLGMALMVPSASYSFSGSAPTSHSDVLNSYLVAQCLTEGKASVYRFVAAWEKTNPRFTTLSSFQEYLDREAIKMGDELKITW